MSEERGRYQDGKVPSSILMSREKASLMKITREG